MSVRLHSTRSKNAVCFYAIEDFVNPQTGKRSTRTIESLGSLEQLLASLQVQTEEEVRNILKTRLKEKYPARRRTDPIPIAFDPDKPIEKEQRQLYNVGYFFLKRILYCLGLGPICARIPDGTAHDFDLQAILELLVYTRILYLDSDQNPIDAAGNLLFFDFPFQTPDLDRAFRVLEEQASLIQDKLTRNATQLLSPQKSQQLFSCIESCQKQPETQLPGSQFSKADRLVRFLSQLTVGLFQISIGESWPEDQIIETIRKMNVLSLKGQGFVPAFERTDLSDHLFDVFGFRMDHEIMTRIVLKKILTRQKTGSIEIFPDK